MSHPCSSAAYIEYSAICIIRAVDCASMSLGEPARTRAHADQILVLWPFNLIST